MLASVFAWESAATIGVASTVAIILAIRSSQIIGSVGKVVKIVLKYRLAKAKIPAKVKTKQANLATKVEQTRKRVKK